MQCNICELKCDITAKNYGRCAMYSLKDNEVVPRYENQVSSFTIGRIEDVPILHHYPGSLTLLLGTASCNFDCAYCENSYISREKIENLFRYRLTPEELVKKAILLDCKNIAFTVNEPAVSFPYFLELADTAKKAGLKVGCATNGYFTIDAISTLAEKIDFVNVSLKSLRDGFYEKSCHVPSAAPVLRNIKILHDKGVHLEITTPVTPDINETEAEEIARAIGAIDKNIPWHIFWLLPEYKMEGGEHVPVDRLIKMRDTAKKYLNYVFIGNLVGSEWLDTACPSCHQTVIKRLNALGCGCQLVDYYLKGGKCPNCGDAAHVVGELSLNFKEEKNECLVVPETESPSLGLLDVHGYQKLFDFRTGEQVRFQSPLLDKVGNIMHGHPYPGDEKPESDTWAADMALEMVDIYHPDLVMLDFAQAWFLTINQAGDKDAAFANVFRNVNRFLDKTGYTPLVIGLGGFEKVKDVIDLEELFGSEELTISMGKSAHFSRRALEKIPKQKLAELSRYWKIYTKQEYLDSLTSSYTADFAASITDYVAVAEPGVVFKGLNSFARLKDLTTSLNKYIPVYTTLKPPEDITQVAPTVSEAVRQGKKVALIIVEGAGIDNFPMPSMNQCRNYDGIFIYELHQQYITLGTGIPYCQSEYRFPLGKDYWLQDYRPYPFSGRFHRFLNQTIGRRIGDKTSLSIGNRNILTHVCLEADISLECYCCYQHNFGTMAVFQQKALNQNIKTIERRNTKSHV